MDDPHIRRAAVRAFRLMKSEVGIDTLVRALDDSDSEARYEK